MQWKETRVSTPEQIFGEIKTKVAQPVGIILFGADCDFKRAVLHIMLEKLQGRVYCFADVPDDDALMSALQEYPVVVAMLDSDKSGKGEARRALIEKMYRFGARTVVGVYAKINAPQPLPGHGFIGRPELKRLSDEALALKADPPTNDEGVLNRMITVVGEG